MVYDKIPIHKTSYENVLNSIKKKFPKDYGKIKSFIDMLEVENNIKPKTSERHLFSLKNFRKFVKKDFSKVTRKDLEKYKMAGLKSASSFRGHLMTVKKYYEEYYPEKYVEWKLKKWFYIPKQKSTPTILSETEVEKLYKSCKNNQDKFIVAVLFDSGARIEEFLNIRFEDIIPPTEDFPYYKIDLKQEYSKTEGRTIGLYWKYSNEAISEYLKETPILNLNEQVLKKEYGAIRMFLSRLGKRVLDKRVHPHIFRKSSATHYANLDLGREKLCIRYGWAFSSTMVDTYIKRAGIQEDKVKEKIVDTNLKKLSKENEELKTRFGLLQETSEKQIKDIQKLIEGHKFLEKLAIKYIHPNKEDRESIEKKIYLKSDVEAVVS
jgi:site-specific recombinase XerD|tara:strand:+ start:151 stop:1287 length:1137 start_codon:yes stop_codon:yes gene_type:complete